MYDMMRRLIFIIVWLLPVLDVAGQDLNSINAAKQQYDDLVKREEDKLAGLERSLQQAYADYNNAVRQSGANSDNAQQHYKWILVLQSDIERQKSIVDNAKKKRRGQVNFRVNLYNKTVRQQNKDQKDQRRADFFAQKQLEREQEAEKAEERRRQEEAKDNMRAQMAYDSYMAMSQGEFNDKVSEARWRAEGEGAAMVANSFRAQDFIVVGKHIERTESQHKEVDLSELESLLKEAEKEAEQEPEMESEVHTFTGYVKDGVVYPAEDENAVGQPSADQTSYGFQEEDMLPNEKDMSFIVPFPEGFYSTEPDTLLVLYELCRDAFAIQSNIYDDTVVPLPEAWKYVDGKKIQDYHLFSFESESCCLHLLLGEDFESMEQFKELVFTASMETGYVFHYYEKNAVLYDLVSRRTIEILINDYGNIGNSPNQIVTFPTSDFPSDAEMFEIFDSKINAIRSVSSTIN